MKTTKKTKPRPAPKRRTPLNNGEEPCAAATADALIDQMNAIELKGLAQKIQGRLRELERAAPDPVMEDYRWIFEQCNAGKMRQYFQQHIAVVDRKIIWSGDNSLDLVDRLAKEHGVHPDRIVIFFVG